MNRNHRERMIVPTALRCAAGILLLGTLAPPPRAADDEAEPNRYQSLLDNSPFLTPEFKARLGQRDTSALRFVGYTRVGEHWFFALADGKSQTGYWLKLNEEQNHLKVDGFDEKAEKIHVSVGGIAVDLQLVRGK